MSLTVFTAVGFTLNWNTNCHRTSRTLSDDLFSFVSIRQRYFIPRFHVKDLFLLNDPMAHEGKEVI